VTLVELMTEKGFKQIEDDYYQKEICLGYGMCVEEYDDVFSVVVFS
jgi:hypothetical protein